MGIPITPLLQYVGFPTRIREFKFYDTALDNHVEYAFQALALDERRSPYVPCLWNKQPGSTTQLVQCWFPGVHSNVGGSYPDNGIGEITLAWMMSKLSPFLEFEPGFIKLIREENEEFLRQSNGTNYLGWAEGKIVDSAAFPKGILGLTVRTPGQYHQTDLATGRAIASQPKLHTNERIHASVRARVQAKATDVGGKTVNYSPKALEDWQTDVSDGKEVAFGSATWTYHGAKHGDQLETLPEDELGEIELELLALSGAQS